MTNNTDNDFTCSLENVRRTPVPGMRDINIASTPSLNKSNQLPYLDQCRT